MLLGNLPPELYYTILDNVDLDDLQSTTLALSRAIPYAPIPFAEYMLPCIRLRAPQRVVQLHRRLRGAPADTRYVRELRIESWTADAQVIINLLDLLDDLTSLSLFVGPNFAPENLLEIFECPRESLQMLSLRFRPYVQRANYYHFLKGAYFDPTIAAIADWPSSSLQSLSIVQDPFIEQVSFAQPLVFFTFKPFLSLSTSPIAQNITALRIRVPARDVSQFLTVSPESFPALRTLDLSTGNIKSPQLARLLARFDRIQNVRLSACGPLAGREPSEWTALGRECALSGSRRAKEREKALKVWREAQLLQLQPAPAQQQRANRRERAIKKGGRKGLATAAISIRGASAPTLPIPSASSSSMGTTPPVDPVILEQKIRVAPMPPSLLTLTASIPPPLADVDITEYQAALRAEFEEGWAAGINQLRAVWTRLHISAQNDVRVVALGPGARPEAPGLTGLEDIDHDKWRALEDGQYRAPLVCFAGDEMSDKLHEEGCGHDLTKRMWGDSEFLRDDIA